MDGLGHSPSFTAAVFALAGLVKGITGMGLPTVGVGLLGLVMAPAEAAALVVVPSLVTNAWQMIAGPALRALARRLAPMLVMLAVGVWAAGGLLTGAPGLASALLGVTLVAYAALALLRPAPPRVPGTAERWLGPPAGLLTGIVTAATGIFVIPSVPYIQALGLDREQLVQALGLSFTVSTLALGASLAASGTLGTVGLASSSACLAPAALGMLAGQLVRHRLSLLTFRRGFLAALLLLGGHLALRPLLP